MESQRIMKYAHTSVFLIWILAVTIVAVGCGLGPPKYMDGDIVFQSLPSAQSQAVAIATGSQYTHCGMILIENGKPFVLEAVGPVREIPLEDWIAQGADSHFVAKRLQRSEDLLDEEAVARLHAAAAPYMDKPYDFFFEWSDEKIYCSELVWKLYKSALDVEVGKRQKLRDFNLDHPVVAELLRERFPDGAPLDEPVISPAAIFDSKLLVTVHED